MTRDDLEEKENDSLTEIAAKNEELQKELHTLKKVIETLRNELCQQAEEIRMLKLELQEQKSLYERQAEEHTDTWSLMNDFHNDLEEISKSKTQESKVASEFREIIEEMIQLYISKNKDYGNAFSQSYDEFGAVMSAIRINDKLNRFKTLIKQDSEVKTESVKDTLIDLANYAVMTIIEINRRG